MVERRTNADQLHGTLDMLVLKALQRGPAHGYGISVFLHHISDEVLQVEEGSLYPALQRMLIKGWIAGEWGRTSENRRARYYKLTAAGKKHLEREIASYTRVAQAIALILQPT